MSDYTVVALDLEGTLVSNAMSQFPRKGLHRFLELCHAHLPHVVLYTAVREPLARRVIAGLVEDGFAPAWFAHIEYIPWQGPHKNLGFIPGHRATEALLVDDNPGYVHPAQRSQWVSIQEFAAPYDPDDELERVWTVLCDRCGIDVPWSA